MNVDDKIYIAGHDGLVGSAIARALSKKAHTNILTIDYSELDLTNSSAVQAFFNDEKPAYVFLAAAKVGGIKANDSMPVDFLLDNLKIQTNVIEHAYQSGVQKLLFLGSSCIYPKMAPQPLAEESLLTGPLEKTNEWYAVAKIAGIKLCQAYRKQYGFNAISIMPTNLYGPKDNYDLENSHVLPALIRKCHEAKMAGDKCVSVWGTGSPRREFLYSDDLADACLFLMSNYDSPEIINVGVGEDITIKELAELVKRVVGFNGELSFDTTKPDGTPRKLMDVSKLNQLGWKATMPLTEGIEKAYQWFLDQGV